MNSPSEKPSLQMIADRAGVSRATVSMALRNHRRTAEATRVRIHEIALELGYRPNPLVSTLMAHIKSQRPPPDAGAIGFVTNFHSRDAWRREATFRRYFEGASERAQQLGYHLDEMWLREPGMNSRKMQNILVSRGIEGLLLAPLPSGSGHFSLDVRPFAGATVGFSVARPNLHRAVPNQIESLRLAIRQMRHLGYRRIALAVHSQQDRRNNYYWTAAYLCYQEYFSPADRIPILFLDRSNNTELTRWTREWKPEAVLSGNVDILSRLGEIGVTVPDDIGVAVLDRTAADIEVAGIDQQHEIAGAAALDLIIGQIQRNERGVPATPKLTLVGGTWVPGGTLRQVSPARKPPRALQREISRAVAAPRQQDLGRDAVALAWK